MTGDGFDRNGFDTRPVYGDQGAVAGYV